jgi:hypothetical protein
MQHGFMSVDTKLGAGRAFLRSLYEQYAEWGVDFGNLLLLTECYPERNVILLSLYALPLNILWD